MPLPGVAAARLLLPVVTLETPGAVASMMEMPGAVVVVRLLLLLLVVGRLLVPPLAVVAGKEVGLSFCPRIMTAWHRARQCDLSFMEESF